MMDDRVAIRAHGPQIIHGIDSILTVNVGKWSKMMDVDEPFKLWPVCRPEVEMTGVAPRLVCRNAELPGLLIAFVPVDHDPLYCTFAEFGSDGYFIREVGIAEARCKWESTHSNFVYRGIMLCEQGQ